MPDDSASEVAGAAYGLTFVGRGLRAAVDEGLLLPAVPGWLPVEFELDAAPAGDVTRRIGPDSAEVPLGAGGRLAVHRNPAHVHYGAEGPVDAHTLVHPGLAWPAAVFAYWERRLCLHGGAVVGAEGAWAVVGSKGAGKSTLLAHLAAGGVPVLSDDLVVVRHGSVCAGPRGIDLRGDATTDWHGPPLVPVRTAVDGGRWRLMLGPIAAEVPLRGVLCMWFGDDDTIEMRPAPGRQRLDRLARHLSLFDPPPDPSVLLDAATVPVFDVVRPQQWGTLPATIDVIRTLIGV
ncbi:MAG: hypothetical protein ACT452_12285 [Microthrixaceae bacterium]